MGFFTLAALLFCVGPISSYWTLFRPELLHMSPVRKVILAFATVIIVVYGFEGLIWPGSPYAAVGDYTLAEFGRFRGAERGNRSGHIFPWVKVAGQVSL